MIDAIVLLDGLVIFVKDRSMEEEEGLWTCEHCGVLISGDEKVRTHRSSAHSPCNAWVKYLERGDAKTTSWPSSEILVITWNTHLAEDGVVNGIPQSTRLSHAMIAFRVAELVLEECRPTILSLQGVRDTQEMASLMKRLHFILVGAVQSFHTAQESWTCLFVRGIDTDKVQLAHYDDATTHGGVCVAEIDFPRITLVSAHFAAGHTKPNSRVGVDWVGVDVRREQSAGIRRYLEARRMPELPVICLGDFNFREVDGKDESLGDVKGMGPWQEAKTGHTYLNMPPLEGHQRQRYDRIYVAGAASQPSLKINKAWTNHMWSVSDHAAVVAVVAVSLG